MESSNSGVIKYGMTSTFHHIRLYNARFRMDQVLHKLEADGKPLEPEVDAIVERINKEVDLLESLHPQLKEHNG